MTDWKPQQSLQSAPAATVFRSKHRAGTAPPPRDQWVSVQAVYVDDQDKLWVVDPAAPGFAEVYQDSDKLVRIDPRHQQDRAQLLLQGAFALLAILPFAGHDPHIADPAAATPRRPVG